MQVNIVQHSACADVSRCGNYLQIATFKTIYYLNSVCVRGNTKEQVNIVQHSMCGDVIRCVNCLQLINLFFTDSPGTEGT